MAGVISRIKIMADLDIAERRVPQDGRVSLNIDGRGVDVRVATLPLVGGESAVLRVLDKDGAGIDLDKLGMVDPERERFVKAFSRPHGAILVTGPDRLGQDDDALRRAADAAHAGEEHHHHRGPGRVRALRHQADADQHQGGSALRHAACAR